MSDDLKDTNNLNEVFLNNNNEDIFNKYVNIKKNYSSIYNSDSDILNNFNDQTEDDISLSDISEDDKLYENYVAKNKRNNQNLNINRTFINIDSNNRKKNTTFNIVNSFKLITNPFFSGFNTNTIKIIGKHPFNDKDSGITQIIFENLSTNDNYLDIGINKEYIEYSNNLDSIFTINKVFTSNIITESYFTIKLSSKVNISLVKTANFGGSNVICKIINNIQYGYPLPSHYKIFLDRTFSNISSVRLISTEIPNTSYTIISNKISTNFQGNSLTSKINNKLMWINEDEYVDTFNVKLYSDEVYFKSINKNVLFTDYQFTYSEQKDIYSKKVWNKIKLKPDLLESFSKISNINSVHFDNNSNKDFFSPIQITLDSHFRHPDTGIILTPSSQPTDGKYWVGNCFHNFQKTLLYDLDEVVIKNGIESIAIDKMNDNLENLKISNPHYYRYYSRLLKTNEDIDIDYNINSSFKNIDSIGIPKFLGYFIFNTNKNEHLNISTKVNEYIHINDLHSAYIYPSTSLLSEKLISPVLYPGKEDKESGLILKNYKRYPVHNVLLEDGQYSKNQLIKELEFKLNSANKIKFNYNEQTFEELTRNDNNNEKNTFTVNISNNLNYIDIRQYKLKDKYTYSKFNNNNMVYYNEGFPYFIIKSIGHDFITGDKILIDGFTSNDGIDKKNVNGEKIVITFPTYRLFLRIIYPLPGLSYLDQEKFFNDLIGSIINLGSNSDTLAYKRDLRKMCIKEDNINYNNQDPYYGNYEHPSNINNQMGNSNHSNKENYPLKTKGDNKDRFYGDFNNESEYKFGIYNNIDNLLDNRKKFTPPLPKSLTNIDDGTLLHKLSNDNLKTQNSNLPDTLQTNMNYFGTKLVNSVNNGSFYPEYYNEFLKNEINTGSPDISLLENEIFIKLDQNNNVNDNTLIGRINYVKNTIDNNFEVKYDLMSNIKNGNFNIGDIIIGLESNCIAMIIPESWDYDGLPIDPVISKGLGTYVIEKFKKNFTFLKNIVEQSKRGYNTDISKFSKKFNKWEIEKINNASENIYINITDIPIKTQLEGLVTNNFKIYKPIKYKFLFDGDEHPNNQLNLGNEDFSHSQSNLKKYDINSIKNSYLLGVYNNTKSNYIAIETNNKVNFQKNDVIYIQNHKIFNKYRNNLSNKYLDINNITPFRAYLTYLKNIFDKIDNNSKMENDKVIPFRNVNVIYDYVNSRFKFSLGKEYISSAFRLHMPYESFDDSNIQPLGLKNRLINWFFENPFLWNSNNIEKTLMFKQKYVPSIENKNIIIKLIVSPFDSFGRTFMSVNENEYALKNGKSYNSTILKEGPYYEINNTGTLEFPRNSANVYPFLPGMGVYSWLGQDQNGLLELKSSPTLLGEVVGTSLQSMEDYIDNYNILSYIHMFPKPTDESETTIAKELFDGSERVPGIDYSVSNVIITNNGNNYTEFTKVIFPDPYSYQQTGNIINFNLNDDNITINFNIDNRELIITPEQLSLNNQLQELDNITICIQDDNLNDVTNDLLNINKITVIGSIEHVNNTTIIKFIEEDISDNNINLVSGIISLKINYNHMYRGKKAEGKAIIENGKIIGVNITDSGGGYVPFGINNIQTSSQNINVIFEDIEGGGSQATGIATFSRSASTYAIYVKLNENVFETNNGVVTGFKESMIDLFKRGNNIYFNTQYLKGDGKYSEHGFELNSDEISNNNNPQQDYKSFGNYYWRNRKAAATIYQGYLTHYQNESESIKKYFVSGHLEFFYQNYLQNKCIVNYSLPFSKEEQFFINKHQIHINNKKLQVDETTDINDYNNTLFSNKKFIDFNNRIEEYNLETYPIHSFNSFDSVYIFNNNKFKSKYNSFNLDNPTNINQISINNNQIEKEATGINNNAYKVITPLWNGIHDKIIDFEKVNSNHNILIDLDFSEDIEKGFMNNGKMRVKGQQSLICGHNSNIYNSDILQDTLLENQFVIVDSDTYNKRGTKFLLIKNGLDTYHSTNKLLFKNDIIVIGGIIYGKDENYPSNLNKRSIDPISELSIIKNITEKDNGNILIELNSKLLNDHTSDEIVIVRYKYGELTNTIIKNNNNDYQFTINKDIYANVFIQGMISDESFYSKYISKGDVLCFDWYTERNINYTENDTIPFNIYDPVIHNNSVKKFTTHFNRVKDADYSYSANEILITLENTPYIFYNKLTTFIILKKGNYKNGFLNEYSFENNDSLSNDHLTKNSIKYNCLSTQPILVDNKWYTKIFYQGNKCMNPEYTDSGIKQYFNNEKKNSWETGTPAYNKLSSKKIYIRGMKGVNLPNNTLPTIFNNFNDDIYESSIEIMSNNTNSNVYKVDQTTPVIDGEYIIYPPIKSDYKSYNPLSSITINGLFKSNYELFDKYVNEEIDIDFLLDNYNDRTNITVWENINSSEIDKHLDYNCIVIEGLYLGYGGLIEERYSEKNSIINSVDGFKVVDIFNDGNSNKFIISLDQELLDLNLPVTTVNDDRYSNKTNHIDSNNIINKQFSNLDNNLFKNTIKIGSEGTIFKKKIIAPIKLKNDDYIYLCCPQLAHINKNNSNITNTLFSKILLTGETNKVMYNTFVSGIKEFSNSLLPELKDLEFNFITSNGDLFDFNGLEHSFSLEITEITQQIDKMNSISGLIS